MPLVLAIGGAIQSALGVEPARVVTRVEMFVDNWFFDTGRPRTVSHVLHPPVRQEVVLVTDKPWEGPHSGYFSVKQAGGKVRLYYRGFIPAGGDASEKQVTCLAESDDGIRFYRPILGLHEFNGSRSNNIIYQGPEAHNFAPFIDGNPDVSPEQRFKA